MFSAAERNYLVKTNAPAVRIGLIEMVQLNCVGKKPNSDDSDSSSPTYLSLQNDPELEQLEH